MKTKDIAAQYSLDQYYFEEFLMKNKLDYKEGFMGKNVNDSKVEEYVRMYMSSDDYLKKKEKEENEQRKKEEALREKAQKQQALSQMLISSGFSFEGYRIVKYSGYISGDDAVQIPRGFGGWFSGTNHGEDLTNALVKIRRQALKELKEAAYDLGCNAVIGVDFDYITLEPQTANLSGGTTYEPYVICVTANGNAVVIEKE